MIAGLKEAGVTPHVMLSPEDPRAGFLRERGVACEPLALRSRLDLRAVFAIRAAARRSGCDVLHALRNNRPIANALLATRGMDVRLVCYRGTLGNLHWLDPGSRLTYLSGRLDRIVCVSDAVRSYLLTLGLPPARLVTIYKGHDPSWYQQPAPRDLATLGLPANAFIVGCAANMRPLKGVDYLIRALDHVSTPRPVHLLLIGEVRDPAVARLAANARYRNRVHLTGYREDAAALLGACHVAAMPSVRREGLPRAIIEAMSQSVPTLVTQVGGMVELVEDGCSGFVVPPADSRALARAIDSLAADETQRRAFGARSLEIISTRFSLRATVEQTLALYRELVPGAG